MRFVQTQAKPHRDYELEEEAHEHTKAREVSSSLCDMQSGGVIVPLQQDTVAALKAALDEDMLYRANNADAEHVAAEAHRLTMEISESTLSSEELDGYMERHELEEAVIRPLVPAMAVLESSAPWQTRKKKRRCLGDQIHHGLQLCGAFCYEF